MRLFEVVLDLLHFVFKLVPHPGASDVSRVRPPPCEFEDVANRGGVSATHRVQVGGERIGVSGFKLLDEALDRPALSLFCGHCRVGLVLVLPVVATAAMGVFS